MKKSFIIICFLLISFNAYAFDYKLTNGIIAFESLYDFNQFVKHFIAKNKAGIKETAKNAMPIHSGTLMSVDHLISERDDVWIGCFIFDGKPKSLYAFIFTDWIVRVYGQ